MYIYTHHPFDIRFSRTTITTNLSTLILMYIKSLPNGYRIMLAGPNVMLMNIMACRVFRKTKLGPLSYGTPQSVLSISNIVMAPIDNRDDSRMHSMVSSKINTGGNQLDSIFNITIDLGTGERGVERSTTTERPKISADLESLERGFGAWLL